MDVLYARCAGLDVPEDSPVIGMTSKVSGRKNHTQLVRELPPLTARFPGLQLWIHGEGPSANCCAASPPSAIDGVTGALCPVDDGEVLREAVTRLLGDPARASTLGTAGRARASRSRSGDDRGAGEVFRRAGDAVELLRPGNLTRGALGRGGGLTARRDFGTVLPTGRPPAGV